MLIVDISRWPGLKAKEANDKSVPTTGANNEPASAMDIAARLLNHGRPRLEAIRDLALGVRVEHLLFPEDSVTKERLPVVFGEMADAFSRWLAEDSCVIAVVADVEANKLQPLDDAGPNSETLISMLILVFPEIRWLFGAVRGLDAEKTARFVRNHGVHRLFKDDGSPLFDGYGLREWVRARARGGGERQVEYLPERRALAVSMDEELGYAYLHAWAAYRSGFRVGVAARKSQADQWLGNEEAPPCLVMEDLFLSFPDYSRDKGDKYGLSDLQTRENKLPALKTAPYRVIVTVGHHKKADREKHCRNRIYMREPRFIDIRERRIRQKIWNVRKPHSGIFSFWRRSGLAELRFDDCDEGKSRRGKAPGFIWPPSGDDEHEAAGHSSPGILVEIARFMLLRAERLLAAGVATVEQAVQGAVLASDALELLGGKTPTMSAQALALKHQFELHAECQFCGVEHHLDMRDRLNEIERDAKVIARWYHPSIKKKTALNIRLDVVNKLVRILRDYNQFDEERYCMVEARRLHRKLYIRGRWWRRGIAPFVWYADWLLSSFPRFAGAIGIWVATIWAVYHLLGIEAGDGEDRGDAFGYAVGTFFGVDTVANHPFLGVLVIMAGLFHLGIFISLIYDLVNRR